MHPADQRLRADHLTVEEPDLGLEVDGELAVRDGVAQLREDREPLRAPCLELATVDLNPGTPGLRGVHRDVGLPKQVPRVSVRSGRGDAQAGFDGDLQLVELEGQGERVPDHGSHRSRARLIAVEQQDRELVAAEARNEGVGPRGALKAVGDHAEQGVTRVVPERVVDVLEPVQVEQDRAGLTASEQVLGESSARGGAG